MQPASYIFNFTFTYIPFLSHQCSYSAVNCTVLTGSATVKLRWCLPVSSAAHPVSPCSVISPPAAHTAGWRCPAWSLSAHLKKKNTPRAWKRSRNQINQNSVSFCRFYLQWSRRSLCLLGLWWCNALSAASWSSVTSDLWTSTVNKTMMAEKYVKQ